ncbi:hypothetical protein [Chryseobacterium sp. OSA05B]|uniref:hypothetical protein n=1 Tax=Chryseobacterium sp. OSA05B TaxID=2862650 RepID=UPI001CBE7DB5|nr:hypothetical protein [Chryseobacterium sp. OSA05B]
MKGKILFVAASVFSTLAYSQVGINTPSPTSTLDLVAKNPTGTTTSVDGLLIPRVDRQRAQSMTTVPTSTLVYINSVTTGTQTGTAINVDTIGYYYYNGTAWVKLNSASGSSNNIYSTDGTLAANRTVTQADKTLAFTGSAVNAFSVDGATLSVDAANNRVGIGTTAPNGQLQFGNSGANRKIVLYETGNNDHQYYGFGINNRLLRYQTDEPTSDHGFFSGTDANTSKELMRIKGDGNVGIGTSTPQKTFHVNGTAQITNELNVGGTATTPGSAGTSGQVLTSSGPNTAPAWASVTSNNIYSTDGTLAANRTVTQADKTLAFTGTSVNAFSVDGATLSVDAANNRVGIGTTAPHSQIHLGNSITNRKIIMYENGDNDNQFHGFGINGSLLRYQVGETSSDHGFFAGTGANNSVELMRIKGNGNVGIGTSTPQKTFHINGAAQITNELNVGGNANTAGSAGNSGQVLTSNGANTAPAWKSLDAGGFIPKVVAAGRTSAVQSTTGAGFKKIQFGSITNPDGAWSSTNYTYTVPTSGYYQVSLFAAIKSTTAAYNYRWLFTIDGARFPIEQEAGASGPSYTARGGAMTTYANAGSVIAIGYEQGAEQHDIRAGATFAIISLGN